MRRILELDCRLQEVWKLDEIRHHPFASAERLADESTVAQHLSSRGVAVDDPDVAAVRHGHLGHGPICGDRPKPTCRLVRTDRPEGVGGVVRYRIKRGRICWNLR